MPDSDHSKCQEFTRGIMTKYSDIWIITGIPEGQLLTGFWVVLDIGDEVDQQVGWTVNYK